ncbi:DUF4158 domain-containing protein [Streptomyces syringium]|uniref:DUF4158 domain-containing protein n=1 Tax=Streptomyces syringium TaxID=76729 RepID=UPI003452EB27
MREFFTPSEGETGWALERTHQRAGQAFALLVLLKSCGRLGYFPDLAVVAGPVVEHIGVCLGLPEGVAPVLESVRTAKRYRAWIRERLGLVRDPGRVRAVAE